MFIIQDNYITVKPCTLGELAQIYHVDYRTLKKWIAPFNDLIGEKIGRFYNVRQVLVIFEKVELPCKVLIENLFAENQTLQFDPEKKAFVLVSNKK